MNIIFNRSKARQESAEYPFETININSFTNFDSKNETKALISFSGADEVAKKVYYSKYESLNPCPTDLTIASLSPDLYVSLENKENQKNMIFIDEYYLFHKFGPSNELLIKGAGIAFF